MAVAALKRKPQLKTFHATMHVTRVEEWFVEAETAEEARELLLSGDGHRWALASASMPRWSRSRNRNLSPHRAGRVGVPAAMFAPSGPRGPEPRSRPIFVTFRLLFEAQAGNRSLLTH